MRILAIDPALGVRGALAFSAAALGRGNILVWFPEGWRSRDGNLQPFLPGIGALLLRSPAPVVPVYISGTFDAWPPHRRFPRPRPLTVRFGKPFDPKQWALGRAGEPEEQIALTIKEAVAALGQPR